jgi:hypothetical protein
MGFFAIAAVWACAFIGAVVQAAQTAPSAAEIEDIVNKVAAKETEFAQARANYLYRQSVNVQELTDDGMVGGEYELVSDIIFTPEGRRQDYVVQGPINTLQRISLDAGDQQDLRSIQPFVLTTEELGKYQVDYLIWVEESDLQIVKSYGRGVGMKKNGFDTQYPKFETRRKRVDGKYWFPVSTTADDTLNFQSGPQRMRMTVKYEEYKQFKSTVTITFQ